MTILGEVYWIKHVVSEVKTFEAFPMKVYIKTSDPEQDY